MARNIAVGAAVVAVLVALWRFPVVFFANPGTNDAIWLADLELPVLLIGLVGIVIAVLRSQGAARATVGFALSALMAGVALGLATGLLVFGNLSNDRFALLLFLPPLLVLAGVATLTAAVAVRGLDRRRRLLAVGFGLIAALIVDVWILLRGSRDWLLAPYGFDIVVLILVAGLALVTLRQRADG